ncbi:MAG TPA: hypothetical protein VLA60_14400, partial [Nitrospirales bacterium]|nr:hypothetical protein [Nitrospirales bacterium]
MTTLFPKLRLIAVFFLLTHIGMGSPSSQAGEAHDLLAQAFSSYEHQQWTAAIAPLERALTLYPGYAEAHHLLGLILNNLDQPAKA